MPMLAVVLTPDRWLLWLGVLFVLSVYYWCLLTSLRCA